MQSTNTIPVSTRLRPTRRAVQSYAIVSYFLFVNYATFILPGLPNRNVRIALRGSIC